MFGWKTLVLGLSLVSVARWCPGQVDAGLLELGAYQADVDDVLQQPQPQQPQPQPQQSSEAIMPDNLPLIFRSLLAKRQQAQAQAQVRVLQNEPTGKAAASRPLFMSGVVYMAPLSEALSHDDFYHKQGEHCNTTALWAMFYDSCKGWINVMRSNIKQNQVGAIGTGAAATAATNNNVAELDAKFFHEYGHRYQNPIHSLPVEMRDMDLGNLKDRFEQFHNKTKECCLDSSERICHEDRHLKYELKQICSFDALKQGRIGALVHRK